MSLDIVRGKYSNVLAITRLIEVLNSMAEDSISETLYIGYPLSANVDSSVTVDAMLVSERYGLVSFIFSNTENAEEITETQGELFYQLLNTLTQYPSLRKGKLLAFEPHVISITPEINAKDPIEEGYTLSTFDNLSTVLRAVQGFDVDYYHVLVESLQKVSGIKPRKKRENVKISGSKGDKIRKIEKEIANLDQWQKKAALEIVEGPQRIRGLAGSGKTIVLALKAAYLHAQYPEWDIVVTYYTRSLWQQYHDLINKFYFEFAKDEPNWNKLHLFQSWGSFLEQGLYSEIARSAKLIPINYTNARLKYGRDTAFSGVCAELLDTLSEDYQPQYDVVLIDEAQDMPAAFFGLVYRSVNQPKRIVWAYDELQNLGSTMMPSIEEMFGKDETGASLVELINKPDQPTQDIILPVCYRNPPWSLALAHALGFGIYHAPLIQHFDTLGLWEDIGYKLDKGTLNYGKKVELSRSKAATPSYFFDLLDPEEVIQTKCFSEPNLQYDWVAKEIHRNITEDELDPDDILVIFPSVITAKSHYQKLVPFLNKYGIASILAGVTEDRDIFRVQGRVSCSAIYRAKGNEAPMVYIVNSDYCHEGFELTKLRNTIFTAITRSRAWVRICGIGERMEELIKEIEEFKKADYSLKFKIPTETEMRKLKTINKERSITETKKIEEAQKGVRLLIDLVNNGEIDASQIPELSSLMKLMLNNRDLKQDDEDE